MSLDLRKPLAVLFVLLGLLLAGYGLAVPGAHGDVVLSFNVNAVWGSVMVLFGVLLLAVSWRR